MKRSAHHVRLVFVAIIASLCLAPAFQAHTPDELDSTARARIEQARSSIVIVRAENESTQKVSQAVGFLIRSDLVATYFTYFHYSLPPFFFGAVRVAASLPCFS